MTWVKTCWHSGRLPIFNCYMNKIFDHSLPIICCAYFLLIAYGIVKLPPPRQQKFDAFMSRKRPLMLAVAYIIIAFSSYLIIRDLS